MSQSEISIGLTVQASDGEAGRVVDVLVDKETGSPRGLVVQARGFFGSDVVLPAEAVNHVEGGRAYVTLTRAEVAGLPKFDAGRHGAAQGLVSQAALGYDRPIEDKE
jgi:hypothetical protein